MTGWPGPPRAPRPPSRAAGLPVGRRRVGGRDTGGQSNTHVHGNTRFSHGVFSPLSKPSPNPCFHGVRDAFCLPSRPGLMGNSDGSFHTPRCPSGGSHGTLGNFPHCVRTGSLPSHLLLNIDSLCLQVPLGLSPRHSHRHPPPYEEGGTVTMDPDSSEGSRR